jgi:hypothetical protein
MGKAAKVFKAVDEGGGTYTIAKTLKGEGFVLTHEATQVQHFIKDGKIVKSTLKIGSWEKDAEKLSSSINEIKKAIVEGKPLNKSPKYFDLTFEVGKNTVDLSGKKLALIMKKHSNHYLNPEDIIKMIKGEPTNIRPLRYKTFTGEEGYYLQKTITTPKGETTNLLVVIKKKSEGEYVIKSFYNKDWVYKAGKGEKEIRVLSKWPP